jgi:hypothetical protein
MACGMFSTPIKRIIENPRDYDGKKVIFQVSQLHFGFVPAFTFVVD